MHHAQDLMEISDQSSPLPYHWPNANFFWIARLQREPTCFHHSQELQVQVQCLHCPGEILGHHAEKTISLGSVGDQKEIESKEMIRRSTILWFKSFKIIQAKLMNPGLKLNSQQSQTWVALGFSLLVAWQENFSSGKLPPNYNVASVIPSPSAQTPRSLVHCQGLQHLCQEHCCFPQSHQGLGKSLKSQVPQLSETLVLIFL